VSCSDVGLAAYDLMLDVGVLDRSVSLDLWDILVGFENRTICDAMCTALLAPDAVYVV
jgi:hypothetical protein